MGDQTAAEMIGAWTLMTHLLAMGLLAGAARVAAVRARAPLRIPAPPTH